MDQRNFTVNKKIIINYILNASYQLLTVLLPIITTPYVARVLGPNNLGINAYTFSIVQVLIIIGMMGIPLYGSKQVSIAESKGKEALSKEFWTIYLVQFAAVLFCISFYIVFTLNQNDQTLRLVFMIQGIQLLGSLLDISWLLIGLQKMKETVTRNVIIKFISIILIFTMVKNEDDLALYVLIVSLSLVFGQIIMWIYASKLISVKPTVDFKHLQYHIKPLLLLFIPQIIGQLYLSFDKIILNHFSSSVEVGYYDQALKIIKLLLTIVTSIGAVMLPNIASEFAKGNIDKVKQYANKVFLFIMCITIPMVFGLISVADNFVGWFLGDEFASVSVIIRILSPIIIFIGLGNLFGIQMLAATNENKKLTISIACGATVSLILCLALTPKFGVYGTSIATLGAETTVAIIQFIFVRHLLKLDSFYKNVSKYFTCSIFMSIVIFFLSYLPFGSLVNFLIQIAVGTGIYFGSLLLIKDSFFVEMTDLINDMLRRKLNLKKKLDRSI